MFCSGFDSELRVSQSRRPCVTQTKQAAVLQDACYLCYLRIMCLLSAKRTSKRTSALQMSKMEGKGSSLLFQSEPRTLVGYTLCIWISQCKLTNFFWVEDFSKSCYILGSHRVLERKHQQCNDLIIKVLHWKWGGFITFLLYSSCGILGKLLKSPSDLSFWKENLSSFGCVSFKLQALSFFSFFLLIWQAPFFFFVSSPAMKIPWNDRALS